VAATERWLKAGAWQRLLRRLALLWRTRPHRLIRRGSVHATRVAGGVLGGLRAGGAAHAVDLPEDRADAMIHVYDGGGVRATGPALLVRKKLNDSISLNGTYYVDMVSNASIDVVTTASPYKETRNEYSLGADYVYQDALITLGTTRSREPDYISNTTNLDVSEEVFGGLTTVSLGFSRGSDQVGKKDVGFFDIATHWKYRVGLTQILTPRWLMSANAEAISDSGFLGSPYRAARVFGATVAERNPRTRSSRAIKISSLYDISDVVGAGARHSVRAEYRYFWDNWAIKAHTLELGYNRYFGDKWLAEGFFRYYKQSAALFYSDNAQTETTYVSRNRQLSAFNSVGLGGKVAYTVKTVPGKYDIKLNGSYQYMRFKFNDFTDVRTGSLYAFNANVLQLFVSATF
jgi:hypothetical protein